MLKRLVLSAAITSATVIAFAPHPAPAQNVLVGGGDCDSDEARCGRAARDYEARTNCGGPDEPTCAEVTRTRRRMEADCEATKRRCENDRHGEQQETDPDAQDDSPRRKTCF